MSTETADPRFADIDLWPSAEVVAALLDAQRGAIDAVRAQAAAIAAAADAAAARLMRGGRLVYAGAGTSGRVAVQDGVELSPTYGWPEDRLIYLLAGGDVALTRAVEGAEDDGDAARTAIADAALGVHDVAIGVAASGRTPYTVAAIDAARRAGALTIGIAGNPDTPLLAVAEHPILLDTGAEAIAGSTRMSAGTAQKAALNALSTAIMIRCGRVYRGLMVDMRISNAKLLARGVAMVSELAGVDEAAARHALEAAGRSVKAAVLVARGATPDAAAQWLAAAGGDLRAAIGTGGGRD